MLDSTAIGMSWEELLHESYLVLQTVCVRPSTAMYGMLERQILLLFLVQCFVRSPIRVHEGKFMYDGKSPKGKIAAL